MLYIYSVYCCHCACRIRTVSPGEWGGELSGCSSGIVILAPKAFTLFKLLPTPKKVSKTAGHGIGNARFTLSQKFSSDTGAPKNDTVSNLSSNRDFFFYPKGVRRASPTFHMGLLAISSPAFCIHPLLPKLLTRFKRLSSCHRSFMRIE